MQIKLCWINQHWNVYLYTEKGYESWCKEPILSTSRDDNEKHKGEYRLRMYEGEFPIFTFGFMADIKEQRPGHGGEWSSNSPNINKIFGTNIIEVGVDQISAAVPLDWLKEQLGDSVVWGKSEWSTDYPEIKFAKVCPKPKDMQWIDPFEKDTLTIHDIEAKHTPINLF